MTSIIKLEAISGAFDDGPLCYLLQVDQFHFLLDCGWDENFDISYIETLKKRLPLIDAILITYSDIGHLGALPVLIGKLGLNCPIYMTVPVYKMGQMFLYDWYLSHEHVEEFQHFSIDDIDAAFDKVQQLKHNQQVALKGKGHGLQITPCNAGHMLGGAYWRITKMGEEDIVYAVDFNHKKERHLNGCSFENIVRPNVLITDSNAFLLQQTQRKVRDEKLLSNILTTLRSKGDVLIVTDTAGRMLEIAHLLDQLWASEDAGLSLYPLVMMSNQASIVIDFAKGQVEWMSDKIMRNFDEYRSNPFELRNVLRCHSMVEVARINATNSPKVIMASMSDMESGFSRDLFLQWCADPKNSIILTQRTQIRTLGAKLIHMAQQGESASRMLTLEIARRINLEGAELEAYYAQRRKEEKETARARLEARRRSARVHTIQDSDSDSDNETTTHEQRANDDPVKAASLAAVVNVYPYDIMHKLEMQAKSHFFKQTRKAAPMYPFIEEKFKYDDYGEIINTADFTITESLVPIGAAAVSNHMDHDGEDLEIIDNKIPTKCIKSVTKLEALCKLSFIEFEGISDGESVKRLIGQIKPKQLILVHAPREATMAFANHCKQMGIAKDRIFTPQLGETVDATIESHIYQVTLSDPLMCSLEFQPVKDAELTWIDARISVKKRHDNVDVENTDTADPMDASTEVTLDLLPSGSIPSHSAVFVNDPKLSDLKQLLTQQGYRPEFSAGVLYVNSVVSIRKLATGKFQIEGTLCDDYYRIRHLIYRQFAIV